MSNDECEAGLSQIYATMCTPSQFASARELNHLIELALDEMPESYRDAILWYRVAGLGYPEIAARMEKSEGAVRNLVFRGLARLNEALRAHTSDD